MSCSPSPGDSVKDLGKAVRTRVGEPTVPRSGARRAAEVAELTAGVEDETSKLAMTVLAIGALGRPREMFETVQMVKRLHGDAKEQRWRKSESMRR